MSRVEDAHRLLDGVFEEQALVIGGLITVHDVEDEFIRRLFRSMGAIRAKAFRSLQGSSADPKGAPPAPLRVPHPAIEEFLARLGRD